MLSSMVKYPRYFRLTVPWQLLQDFWQKSLTNPVVTGTQSFQFAQSSSQDPTLAQSSQVQGIPEVQAKLFT